jgi:hypothetical protein
MGRFFSLELSIMSTETETKKTRQMTFAILESGAVRAEFGEGIDPITFNPPELPEAIFPQAVTAGVIARLRSYTSGLIGEDRTPAKLHDAIARGLADLMRGIWAAERVSATTEYTVEAEAAHLYRAKRAEKAGKEFTVTLAESAADFEALSDEQRKDLKARALYRLCYQEVKESRAAKTRAKLEKKADKEAGDFDF